MPQLEGPCGIRKWGSGRPRLESPQSRRKKRMLQLWLISKKIRQAHAFDDIFGPDATGKVFPPWSRIRRTPCPNTQALAHHGRAKWGRKSATNQRADVGGWRQLSGF